jgi:hypothetical protein
MAKHQMGDIHSTAHMPVQGSALFIPGYGPLIAWGTVAQLPDGEAGYAPGCIYHAIDGSDDTAIYVNEGTSATADFNKFTVQ